MLVLTRKLGEVLVFETANGMVRVKVCGITGTRVRLGCDAPEDVRIDREENTLEDGDE